MLIRTASVFSRTNVLKASCFPTTSGLRQFSGLNHDTNVSDNKTKWEQLKAPLHPYEKPVLWLRNATLNDATSLKKVCSERDAALRSLLKGKEEDLVLQENNLSEFRLMKSKLIFPHLDESKQGAEEEKIALESIPQVPMLRQGALIHRVDNWVQSKVWKPEASPWKMQHFYLYYDTLFARASLPEHGPRLQVEIDTKFIRAVKIVTNIAGIREDGWNAGFKISFDQPRIVASTEPPQRHALFVTADLADAEQWKQRLRVARFYSVHMKCISRHQFLARYPYLAEYEWAVSGRGRGDLVFVSRHGDFAVVEAKIMNHEKCGMTYRSNRNHSRKIVREQSRRYLGIYSELLQEIGFKPKSLKSFVYTNDNPDLLIEIEVQPDPSYRWHGLVQCEGDADLLEEDLEPLSLAF